MSRDPADPAVERPRVSDLVPLAAVGARPTGRVTLVGAGPGDPELLTIKAVRALARADVVVHDRLVSEAVLEHAPAGARRIYVGKRKARHALPQADIDALLVGLAFSGLEVVRLKGGDPFVFGRGGEEMLACRAAGVSCEVVPGVSAALAAAAGAGAPLTHRGVAQALTVVTAHAAPDGEGGWREPDLDWAALARPNATVAVYMGLSTAGLVAERLVAHGRAPSTPVLIVERASLPQERRALTDLAGLAQAARAFDGPAVLIVGETAALAQVEPAPASLDALQPARASA